MSSASASSPSLTAMKGQISVCKIAVFPPPPFPVLPLQTTMLASNAPVVPAPQVRKIFYLHVSNTVSTREYAEN